MSHFLNDAQLQQLSDHVTISLSQLEQEIEHLEVLTQPISPDRSIGRLTRLDALNELAVNEKALASARTRRIGLQVTLSQLRSPEFGCCIHCGEPIPFARLMTVPQSKLCVSCAEQAGH